MYDPALLAELTQKLGSVEKAKEVYALFAASLMTSAPVVPPLTTPADSAAQPANLREERPQESTSQRAETASQEVEKEEAVHKRPKEIDQQTAEQMMRQRSTVMRTLFLREKKMVRGKPLF